VNVVTVMRTMNKLTMTKQVKRESCRREVSGLQILFWTKVYIFSDSLRSDIYYRIYLSTTPNSSWTLYHTIWRPGLAGLVPLTMGSRVRQAQSLSQAER